MRKVGWLVRLFVCLDYDLDFEAEPSYQITITCYDPIHHNTISKNFTLSVSDVNEAPIELILSPNTVRCFLFQLK